MQPRKFGDTDIALSPVCFGSMRLDCDRISFEDAVQLLLYLYDEGVTTFHSSHEYPTDKFFCQALAKLQQARPDAKLQHITKLGVPHFDETEFSGKRLVALVEKRLQELNTERLDLVQWLVRHQPNDNAHRLPILQAAQAELNATWKDLQKQGKVGALASFPYSVAFAEQVLTTASCKGLVTYLNPLELEMAHFLDGMLEQGQGYVAIRPFCGGILTTDNLRSSAFEPAKAQRLNQLLTELELSPEQANQFAVQFPLLHPAVASTMLSVTSVEHAKIAVAAAKTASVNPELFNKVCEIQGHLQRNSQLISS